MVEILTRDLAERRRSLIAYSAGLALYVVFVVAVYPAFKDSTSLDALTSGNPGLSAMFGISGSITSPVGWISANIYANFFPLVILLLTIGYGAQSLAGQEEDGHLELVLSLPFSRRAVVIQKAGAMTIQATVLGAVVLLATLCGRFFELTIPTAHLATATLGVVLLAIDFGLIAMAIGAGTGARALAVGVTTAVAAASYLISSLAPVVHALDPLRYTSLFYWAIGDNQLDNGLTWLSVVVLVGAGLLAAVTTTILFDRHDLRA